MLRGFSPATQALLGTLFTWGVTALGAAIVYVARPHRKFLDASLGFAAGVMLAASYWSLLAPAIALAEESGTYGEGGEYAFIPVALGFLLGAGFVHAGERLLHLLGADDLSIVGHLAQDKKTDAPVDVRVAAAAGGGRQRRQMSATEQLEAGQDDEVTAADLQARWKRTLLLALAVTIHNIPEGLAVGVGFGSVGKSSHATFENARNLAVGIGLQNFPEGLAVSLPLHRAGFSKWSSFWYGQLSGMVEPVAGIFGALAVSLAEPILPYALAFAAGAMVFVVLDDIIPETCNGPYARLATWGGMVGFVVMMSLDVALG